MLRSSEFGFVLGEREQFVSTEFVTFTPHGVLLWHHSSGDLDASSSFPASWHTFRPSLGRRHGLKRPTHLPRYTYRISLSWVESALAHRAESRQMYCFCYSCSHNISSGDKTSFRKDPNASAGNRIRIFPSKYCSISCTTVLDPWGAPPLQLSTLMEAKSSASYALQNYREDSEAFVRVKGEPVSQYFLLSWAETQARLLTHNKSGVLVSKSPYKCSISARS